MCNRHSYISAVDEAFHFPICDLKLSLQMKVVKGLTPKHGITDTRAWLYQ